jgi:hypothetical protein
VQFYIARQPDRWIGAQIDLFGAKLTASRQTATGAHSGAYCIGATHEPDDEE